MTAADEILRFCSCHCNVWFSETERTRKCWTGLWDALARQLAEDTPRTKRLLNDDDDGENQSRPPKRPRVSHAQESDFKYVGVAQNTPDHRDVDRNTEALSERSMPAYENSVLTEALIFLDQLKQAFSEHPRRYERFLDIMALFKSQKIDTVGVLHRVIPLFIKSGRPEQEVAELLKTFNNFLPSTYTLKYSTRSCSITTPDGTITVSDSLFDGWADEDSDEEEEEGEQSGKDSELATTGYLKAAAYYHSGHPDSRRLIS